MIAAAFERAIAHLSAQEAIAHEHAIHFALALGIAEQFHPRPGEIAFETGENRERLDIRFAPSTGPALLIEVKFFRGKDTGRSAGTYNGLLWDFYKIVSRDGDDDARRVVFLVIADDRIEVLEKRGDLPTDEGSEQFVDRLRLSILEKKRKKVHRLPACGFEARLALRRRIGKGYTCFAWDVTRTDPST